MDPPSSIPRPSGIPRPASRLPVLKSASSQSQLRPPSTTAEQLRKKPSALSLSRPSPQHSPALQKKTSRASLVRSNTPSAAPSAASGSNRASLASSTRRVSGIPSIGPKAPTSNEPVFKRPFARPPSRQTSKATLQPTSNTNKEDDALGSLDGFRSASRASSRAGSRADFRETDPEPEYVLLNEPEPDTQPDKAAKKKSRPSLSERTVESLASLPSSPAAGKGRRRSSFFNADNSMPPPLRPASAMSSNSSRPTTSDGTFQVPATPKRFGTAAARLSMTAPGRRSISASVPTPTATPSRTPSVVRPMSTVKKQPLALTQNQQNTPRPRPLSNSKSMVARTPKPRPSLSSMFGQAISPPGATAAAPATPSQTPTRKTPLTARNVSSSSVALREQIAKAKASRKSEVTDDFGEQSPKVGSSSNALREQIAKARETARRTKREDVRTSTPPRDPIVPDPVEIASFDFGLDDPFNQAKGGKSLLRKRIDSARVDGRLNVAAMGLKEIPDDVLQMYKYDPNDTTVAWGEIVDLTSIIAADNEFEALPGMMFPDVDIQDVVDDEEGCPQFGGVQNIDLHGNTLRELPMGLRRLTQLSRLNLSRNKLSMTVFDIVSEMKTLRELKLAENDLAGALPGSVGNMSTLEVLEIQGNKFTSLPDEVRQLSSLRLLNVSSNQLSSIPMGLFETSLVELVANKNRVEGAFFTIESIPHLQELNISNNSLKALCEGEFINMPALKSLNISTNRLVSMPNVESWANLQTLVVAENKLTSFPEGFRTLQQLRTADFTANDITQIDERIALMPLEHLTLAANPLRERKFLTMGFADIKRDLSSRLALADVSAADDDVHNVEFEDAAPSANGWQVTQSGTLDLSSKGLTELDETALHAVAEDTRHLRLQQNVFSSIPIILSTITFLTVLDLSKNTIEVALTSPLTLPKLKDLRLSANRLTSLKPLTTHLTAPSLQTLDVSNNRLTSSLPALRIRFPELISLVASDNAITDLPADALAGFKIVNLANNDIERLEPQIGLLGGDNGLKSLNVEGNKFRVPSYHVLQKGTDAVLSWLRDKIPRESWKSDGTVFFDADDGGDEVTF
ncbi:L domain-like protein [Ophiobolus disseminans]|uniref:L domain-like protein n=1 Tax=Ophiobolus disseminans TaxID=1469910 RepID=A0A6A6ZFD0_9PLEO|nr:L domain-like protein [Ophiobolus disseminans]